RAGLLPRARGLAGRPHDPRAPRHHAARVGRGLPEQDGREPAGDGGDRAARRTRAMKPRLAGLRPSELHPIYPAMVMGTGSLSTGAMLLGFPSLSLALFAIALAAFALLLGLSLRRLARHGDAVRADARGAKTAFAPYTSVAALAVLGNRATLAGLTAAPAAA